VRLTIKDARGTVAQGDTVVHDPGSDAEVIAAAKKVCKARGRTFPADARILVEEERGRRWHLVREVIG
jgi:hypothetical protein